MKTKIAKELLKATERYLKAMTETDQDAYDEQRAEDKLREIISEAKKSNG